MVSCDDAISEADKELIRSENAVRLFGLS